MGQTFHKEDLQLRLNLIVTPNYREVHTLNCQINGGPKKRGDWKKVRDLIDVGGQIKRRVGILEKASADYTRTGRTKTGKHKP